MNLEETDDKNELDNELWFSFGNKISNNTIIVKAIIETTKISRLVLFNPNHIWSRLLWLLLPSLIVCSYHFGPLLGEQGWCSGEIAHLPPMWSGLNSRTRHHMWVEFVVGSLLCSRRFFSGYSGFPLYSKNHISKFQLDFRMQGHILNKFLRTPRCSVGKQITFLDFYNFCRLQ